MNSGEADSSIVRAQFAGYGSLCVDILKNPAS